MSDCGCEIANKNKDQRHTLVTLFVINGVMFLAEGAMSGSKQLLWGAAVVMMTFRAAATGSAAFFVAASLGIAIAVGAAYAVMGGGKNIT